MNCRKRQEVHGAGDHEYRRVAADAVQHPPRCDNLQANGTRLRRAVFAFMERSRPDVLSWLKDNAAFPRTVVDCIVPAATDISRARVCGALGLEDTACVQREPYSQWVIERRFAGPRPAWDRVGVQIVDDVDAYGRLKLHVLNACHSVLAYLGLPRGHAFVREAIVDEDLAHGAHAIHQSAN